MPSSAAPSASENALPRQSVSMSAPRLPPPDGPWPSNPATPDNAAFSKPDGAGRPTGITPAKFRPASDRPEAGAAPPIRAPSVSRALETIRDATAATVRFTARRGASGVDAVSRLLIGEPFTRSLRL